MRVLHLASEYPPQRVFGLGRFVRDLAVAQAARGDAVEVITNSMGGRQADARCDGVAVRRVSFPPPPKPALGTATVAQFNVQLLARAEARLRDWLPDVLNLHDWLTVPAGLALAERHDLPVVFTCHDTTLGKRLDGLDAEDRVTVGLERWAMAAAERTICCSQFVRSELLERYDAPPERLAVLPCGVDPQTMALAPHARGQLAAFRSVLAEPDEPIVLYLGRLDREKGLDVLLNAAPAILARHPKTRFVLVGKGRYGAAIEQHLIAAGLQQRVRMPGYLAGETLALTLHSADVMVVPSRYEPFGIVALEGMSCGLPLVVPDETGLAEIVRHQRDGLQFRAGQPDALAAAVGRLLDDPALARQLGESARAAVGERFAWSRIAADTACVYREALDAPQPDRFPRQPIALPSLEPADAPARASASAAPAAPPADSRHTWAIVVVRDRLALTRRCLEALRRETAASLEVLVIDMGSDAETLRYLTAELSAGRISRLLLNAPGSVPQWQKSAAINQALGLLADEHATHLALVDNDVEVRAGWLSRGLAVLEALGDEAPVVTLASDDAVQRETHPTREQREVAGEPVRLLDSANGALWLLRRDFFARFGAPPIGGGITHSGVEDWHYSRRLREQGCRFAALDGLAQHLGEGHSIRERESNR